MPLHTRSESIVKIGIVQDHAPHHLLQIIGVAGEHPLQTAPRPLISVADPQHPPSALWVTGGTDTEHIVDSASSPCIARRLQRGGDKCHLSILLDFFVGVF